MRRRSLHARFRAAVLSIAAALTTIVAVIVYYSANSYYRDIAEESVQALVATVQKTVAVGLYARDDVLLKELADGLTRQPSIANVEMRDATGGLVESATTQNSGNRSRETGKEVAAPFMDIALMSPFNPDEPVGRMQIWLDSTRLAANARREASILAGALIVLVAGVLSVFNALAKRLLSKPMHRLAAELALIEPGTARRLPLEERHAHDEVGVVTVAANRLLDLQQAALARERTMREEIAGMEARYRGIFDSTSAGIFILSETGDLLQANPALSKLLGMSADELNGASVPKFAEAVFAVPAQLSALIDTARASAQPEAVDLELVRHDGTTLWSHCMVSYIADASSGRHRVEGVLYDITQRKLQEHAAQHRAEHDPLTGLKSRAYIESLLGQHVYAARRNEGSVTLMFIDLDGFKAVNDQWGHAAGDAVLVQTAHRLQDIFRRGCDVVGRLGGDELVVVIEGVEATHPSVSELAARLIGTFKAPFILPNGELADVGASVGVASYPLHATNSKTLIHAADAAMYAVKQSGKGGFVIAET
jgi:diguanylate cyclase (GGDEF)-like protein/PAS domain S-box-containing protein